MNSVERVKTICKERKIPISKLEKDLGFSNGYIGQLRKGTFPAERLKAISEYLNVSFDYLMTGVDASYDYVVRMDDGTEILVEKLSETHRPTKSPEFYTNIPPEDMQTLTEVYFGTGKQRLIEYAKKLKELQDME